MLLYSLNCFLGCIALGLIFWTIRNEQLLREARSKFMLHTRLVQSDSPEELRSSWDLCSVSYILGRRKRKSDLNLDVCHDPSISRIHAKLWFDGQHFCLASFLRPNSKNETTLTFVNGRPVGLDGVVLSPGDVIRLGTSSFTLIDTEEEWF